MSLGPEVRRGGKLPFGMFASRWMCDSRYSTNARTLYAILVTYSDTQTRNTERGKPYRAALAAQLGVSLSTLDRTLAELEAAGLIRIEPRTDPDNPANNDANVYHLLDFPLMYAGNGEWADPLPPGVKAADVAKRLIEERRAAKRAAGEERRGGVPKGVNPKAVKAARKAREAAEKEGGSSTHAATPGSTHAARVAAWVLPYIQNPVHSPSPEPDAPSARSAVPDAGGNSSGSRDRATGGSAASGKSKPRRSKAELQAIRAVREELARVLPDLAAALPEATPGPLGDAILAGLAAGKPQERTPGQLVEFRVLPRWTKHWAPRFYAGELSKQPIGPLVTMLGADWSDHDRCDERIDVDTGGECRACAERAADRRAERQQQRAAERPPVDEPGQGPAERPVPAPRGPVPQWWECTGCAAPGKGQAPASGLCAECAAGPVLAGAPPF